MKKNNKDIFLEIIIMKINQFETQQINKSITSLLNFIEYLHLFLLKHSTLFLFILLCFQQYSSILSLIIYMQSFKGN